MAAVAKSGIVSLASKLPPEQARFGSGLICGEDIVAGDACYVRAADGLVMRSIGTTLNTQAAKVHGFALIDAHVAQNDAVTLIRDVDLRYGAGFLAGGLVGTNLFVSGTVAGGLDTVASAGGTGPVAVVVDDTRIRCQYSNY